jgi:hypothetical protein
MNDMVLTRTRLVAGIWEGVLSGPATSPQLRVSHLDLALDGVEVMGLPDQGNWLVRIPIPTSVISDGLQTFVIADAVTGEKLGSFAMLAGEALDDDLRAEIDLLRAELDLLKRAFRRHCAETA